MPKPRHRTPAGGFPARVPGGHLRGFPSARLLEFDKTRPAPREAHRRTHPERMARYSSGASMAPIASPATADHDGAGGAAGQTPTHATALADGSEHGIVRAVSILPVPGRHPCVQHLHGAAPQITGRPRSFLVSLRAPNMKHGGAVRVALDVVRVDRHHLRHPKERIRAHRDQGGVPQSTYRAFPHGPVHDKVGLLPGDPGHLAPAPPN